MRIIAALHETGRAAYLSHLDMQRTLQRALRRADMPLLYSQGFNPHPLMAFAGALSTGFESEREWFDVRLEGDIAPADFEARLNAVLPEGMAVSHAMEAPEGLGTLTGHLAAARYTLWVRPEKAVMAAEVNSALNQLLEREEIMVQKRTKSGAMVPQNIRPQLYEARLTGNAGCFGRADRRWRVAHGSVCQRAARFSGVSGLFQMPAGGDVLRRSAGAPQPWERKT